MWKTEKHRQWQWPNRWRRQAEKSWQYLTGCNFSMWLSRIFIRIQFTIVKLWTYAFERNFVNFFVCLFVRCRSSFYSHSHSIALVIIKKILSLGFLIAFAYPLYLRAISIWALIQCFHFQATASTGWFVNFFFPASVVVENEHSALAKGDLFD